jgi:hypothetical protein
LPLLLPFRSGLMVSDSCVEVNLNVLLFITGIVLGLFALMCIILHFVEVLSPHFSPLHCTVLCFLDFFLVSYAFDCFIIISCVLSVLLICFANYAVVGVIDKDV